MTSASPWDTHTSIGFSNAVPTYFPTRKRMKRVLRSKPVSAVTRIRKVPLACGTPDKVAVAVSKESPGGRKSARKRSAFPENASWRTMDKPLRPPTEAVRKRAAAGVSTRATA